MTSAAAGPMRCRHLPNGGIQWLLVKPGMCSIRQCILHHTTASAWPSKLPAICLIVFDFIVGHNRSSRLVIPVFRNLFFGPKKPFLPGFLRISCFSCVFWRNFSQERGFGGGCRNSCFWPRSQEFFAGIPAGQEFLYLLRIPPDSAGFCRIPVPAKRCLAQAS